MGVIRKDKAWKIYFSIMFLGAGLLAVFSFYSVSCAKSQVKDIITVPGNFSSIAEKVSPAVVNIRTVKRVSGGGRVFRFYQDPFGRKDPFQDFFEKFFGNEKHREFTQQSLGSGFIIDKKGFIVTNNHVVENADNIKVKLKDSKEYNAEIVGRDPSTDLALIKIKSAQNLPFVGLGNSDDLKVGQWVVAIGSPFGLEHTVTAGIVSAKGRVIGSGPYDNFIQTDASINPGNSGGPLLNLNGEVVGINTAIMAGGHGIGFAIPINLANNIIKQLKVSGEVTRGWLGVGIQDINTELARYYGLEEAKGVLVTEVFPGDPASEAGIKPKDIIIEINGEKVENSRELTNIIADINVGEKVKIIVLRNRNKKSFNVEIARRDNNKIASRNNLEDQEAELGIRVANLTEELARRFNNPKVGGVIIVDIDQGSKGDEAGLRQGDIIYEVNHKAIKNVRDFNKTIGKIQKGEAIDIFLQRLNVGFLAKKLTK